MDIVTILPLILIAVVFYFLMIRPAKTRQKKQAETLSTLGPGTNALLVIIIGLVAWAFWPGTPDTVRLGLDLQGGTQVILVPKPVTAGATITEEQLQQTVAIIRQRVDGLGVAEAEVTTQGSGNGAAIIVSVPGAEQDRLVDLVKRTALLDFRPVDTL